MAQAFLNEDGTVSFKFSGPRFYDLIHECKESFFKFDGPSKMWIIPSVSRALIFFNNISYIEKVSYDEAAFLAKYDQERIPETARIRVPLDETLFRKPPIKGKPGPYENFQLDCIRAGLRQNRFAYFLGMGLGKTFIVINVINQYFKLGKIEKVFIVAPSEAIYNWKHELKMFFYEQLKDEDIYVASVTHRLPFESKAKIIICSYRTLVMLSDSKYKMIHGKRSSAYTTKVLEEDFDNWVGDKSKACLVADEVHFIKNYTSRQSKMVMSYRDYFNYRYILSGTPTPNHFAEIYNPMKLLDQSLVPPTYLDFIHEVADVGDDFSRVVVNYVYPHKQREYEEKFRWHCSRIHSKDALELPELIIDKVYVELSDLQRAIYEGLSNMVVTRITEKYGSLVPKKMKDDFPYISQALDNPCLLLGKISDTDEEGKLSMAGMQLNKLLAQFKFKDHSKLEICDELISRYLDDEKRKVILFDHHPLTIQQLEERYSKYNPLIVHGELKVPDMTIYKDQIVQAFQNDPSRNLLIANFTMLNTAVNLTKASRLIYFCRDWSYTNFSQSMKRAHRIGTQEEVIVQPLILMDSLDDIQDKVLDNKEELDATIFTRKHLSGEAWSDIFSGRIDSL